MFVILVICHLEDQSGQSRCSQGSSVICRRRRLGAPACHAFQILLACCHLDGPVLHKLQISDNCLEIHSPLRHCRRCEQASATSRRSENSISVAIRHSKDSGPGRNKRRSAFLKKMFRNHGFFKHWPKRLRASRAVFLKRRSTNLRLIFKRSRTTAIKQLRVIQDLKKW